MSDVVETLGVEIEIGAKISAAAKEAINGLKKEFEKATQAGESAGGVGVGKSIGDALDKAQTGAKERGADALNAWDSIREAVDKAADSISQKRFDDTAAEAMAKKLEAAAAKAKAEADALASKWDNVRQSVEQAADAIQQNRLGPRSYGADDPGGDWADDGGGGAMMRPPKVDRSQTLGSYLDIDKELSDGDDGRDLLVTLEIFKRKLLGPLRREIETAASEAWGKFKDTANEQFGHVIDTGRKAASVLREVFGENIFTDAVDGALDALENTERIASKMKSLGDTVAKYAPAAGGWITTIGATIAAAVPLVVGGISAMIGAVVSFAAAFALPITAIVTTVGYLGYQWREAGNESEEAIKKMEEADEKLRAMRPRQIQQTDDWYAGDRKLLANKVGGLLDESKFIGENDSMGGLDRFEKAFENFAKARAEVLKVEQDYQSILTEEEQVIGSQVNQITQKLSIQEELKRIAEAEIAWHEQKVAAIGRELSMTRELQSVAEAGLAVLERQEEARMSTREKLARLAPGQREAGLAAFDEFRKSGDTDAGQRAEKILGFQIDAVGKKLAESVKVGNDVLDDFGAKIAEKDQKLIDAVQKAAGGQGIEAVRQYLETLSTQEAEQVRILDDAKSKLKTEGAKLTAIIDALMKEINRLTGELLKVQQEQGLGG